MPSIIWLRMLRYWQLSVQKLHVCANSRRATKKSSNGSPCCCTRFLKFLRSTCFIDLTLHIPFNSCYDTVDFASFIAESEVVHYGDGLAGEAECECLDLCIVGFFREAGLAVVGPPLSLPRFKVGPSVHL